jgi:putative addiction module killer protein
LYNGAEADPPSAGLADGWASSLQNHLLFDNVYPQGYSMPMVEIRKTELFAKWIDNLRDVQAKARVLVRIERLASGNAGDVKPVGEGISEMRIDYGPGYRVYFMQRGSELIILLAGGDKNSQSRDIKAALRLAQNL